MRTLHNYLDAAKQRREDGEAGFSLIELIVVVAILGILVAIAIPVFNGIQQTAKDNAAKTVAANAVTAASAVFAQDETPDEDAISGLVTGDATYVAIYGTGLDDVCAVATVSGSTQASGHTATATTCAGTAVATSGTAG